MIKYFIVMMNKNHKNNIIFLPETKELITGMFSSDGHLQLITKNLRLHFHLKDQTFIDHLYLKLSINNLVKAKPHKNLYKTYTSYKFSTLSLPCLTEIYHHWYTKFNGRKIKIVPSNISELLTPRVMAYWLMGDGYFNKTNKAIFFCTDNFTKSEVDNLQSILLNKFCINSTIFHKDKKYYRIYIPRKDTINLSVLVYPYLIESMLYKIGL
jgi:LAGLIDADG DNA endonuclease family